MTHSSRAPIETLLAESDWVRALARRLTGNDEAAEDLVQETWVAALRRPPEADRPVRPWLATVLQNALRQRYRRGAAGRAREEERARDESSIPSPEELLERLESQELVSRLVRELPEGQMQVVLMRYHDGLKAPQIGERLGISAGTVRWRMKAALDTLRTRLDREFGGDRAAWVALLGRLPAPRGTAAAGLFGGLAAWVGLAASVALVAAGLLYWVEFERPRTPVDELDASAPLVVENRGAREPSTDPPTTAGATRPDRAAVVTPAAGRQGTGAVAALDLVTRLRLRAVDEQGAPIAGARVEVQAGLDLVAHLQEVLGGLSVAERTRRLGALVTETDGAGHASLESTLLRRPGTVRLIVLGPRLGRHETSLTLEPGADRDLGELALRPGALVHCTLVDASGKPAEAEVVVGAAELTGDPSARGPERRFASRRIDYRGDVRVEREGRYRLWTRTFDGAPWSWSEAFELAFGQELSLRVDIGEPRRAITLVIVDPAGAALPARIELRSPRGHGGETGARSGRFELGANYPPGEPLDVEVRDESLRHFPRRVHLDAPHGEVTIALEAAPQITRQLRVVAPDGRPIETFEVRTEAFGSFRTLEGRDGRLTFDLPVDEALGLTVRANECVPFEANELFASDLPDDWTIELAPLSGITGLVTHDGEPVAGAMIRVSHHCDPGEWHEQRGALTRVRWTSGWDALTDRDGRFRLPLQWEGRWMLRVRAPGLADALVDLGDYDPRVGADAGAVELDLAGAIEGRALDATGAPRAGITVAASHGLHEGRATSTDSDGRYRFGELPPGKWRLSIPRAGGSVGGVSTSHLDKDWALEPNVRVLPGIATRHDLIPDAARFLRGRLRLTSHPDGALAALAGWSLSAEDAGPDPLLERGRPRVTLDESGEFALQLEGDGPWTLRLQGDGLLGRVEWDVDAALAADFLSLELALGGLSGRSKSGAGDALHLSTPSGTSPRFDGWWRPDERGEFGSASVPAGELRIQLPNTSPADIDLGLPPAETLDDLIEQAILEAVVSTIPSSPNVATHLHIDVPRGETLHVELPH